MALASTSKCSAFMSNMTSKCFRSLLSPAHGQRWPSRSNAPRTLYSAIRDSNSTMAGRAQRGRPGKSRPCAHHRTHRGRDGGASHPAPRRHGDNRSKSTSLYRREHVRPGGVGSGIPAISTCAVFHQPANLLVVGHVGPGIVLASLPGSEPFIELGGRDYSVQARADTVFTVSIPIPSSPESSFARTSTSMSRWTSGNPA